MVKSEANESQSTAQIDSDAWRAGSATEEPSLARGRHRGGRHREGA